MNNKLIKQLRQMYAFLLEADKSLVDIGKITTPGTSKYYFDRINNEITGIITILHTACKKLGAPMSSNDSTITLPNNGISFGYIVPIINEAFTEAAMLGTIPGLWLNGILRSVNIGGQGNMGGLTRNPLSNAKLDVIQQILKAKLLKAIILSRRSSSTT